MSARRGLRDFAPELLVVSGAAVWWSSLPGAFLYDDRRWIVENRAIRSLRNLPELLSDTSRPVWKLSLALDYAIGGGNPTVFHVTNIVIHLLAALALYGVLRRTLAGPRLAPRFGEAAPAVAFGAALLWLVHPLQTEAVTYLSQRCESLMGLLYLTTLYCAIRCMEGPRALAWGAAAVAACALGMGTKEVMVGAPLLMLLHDRAFASGSTAGALRRHGRLHAGLAATWGVMFVLIGPRTLFYGEMARPDLETVGPLAYALSQPAVVLHYLRLSLWPHPLCFHYDWPPAHGLGEILPPALAVGALGLATLRALWRNTPLGFVGAWFFGALAPSSSIQPIQDLAHEHRMYLSLASVTVVAVVAGHAVASRLRGRARWAPAALLVAAASALGAATIARNRDYRDPIALWSSTLAVAPDNPVAHYNLGVHLRRAERIEEAIDHYRRALELDPDYGWAHNNLGNALVVGGALDEAIGHYRRALAIDPAHVEAHYNLGRALQLRGEDDLAIEQFWRVLELNRHSAEAHEALGLLFERRGDREVALEHYRSALERDPDRERAREGLRRLSGPPAGGSAADQ